METPHVRVLVQGLQPHEEDPALALYKERVLLVGWKSRNRALFDEMVQPMEDLQLLQLSPPSLLLSSQEILAHDALWDACHNGMHMLGAGTQDLLAARRRCRPPPHQTPMSLSF